MGDFLLAAIFVSIWVTQLRLLPASYYVKAPAFSFVHWDARLYAREYVHLLLNLHPDASQSEVKKMLRVIWALNICVFSFFLLATISNVRIFLRTRMKSFLCFAIGGAIVGIGVIGSISHLEQVGKGGLVASLIVFLGLLGAGVLVSSLGVAYFVTAESGVWREVAKRTSVVERMVGSVPAVKKDLYPPNIKRRTALVLGIALVAMSCFLYGVFSRCSFGIFRGNIIVCIVFLVQGMLIIILSLAYLER